jgi:hypothetical protein
LWIGDIVENTPTIPFFNTSNVDIVRFVDSHKIVVQRNAFSTLQMHKMRIKSFGHGVLKCSFSQVEGDLDLQEILKLTPLPKKRTRKNGGYNCDERRR